MAGWKTRTGWALVLVLSVALAASLAGIVRGGSLDPGGSPAPTMKTLDDIPPAWHQSLSASGADACNSARFRCVMGNAAVLDRETGLVWERAPNTTLPVQDWAPAMNLCIFRLAGGRFGWRLPTIVEMRTLTATGQSSPALPPGHPFIVTGLEDAIFWTATLDAADATKSWTVGMTGGSAQTAASTADSIGRHWCVRAADPAAP